MVQTTKNTLFSKGVWSLEGSTIVTHIDGNVWEIAKLSKDICTNCRVLPNSPYQSISDLEMLNNGALIKNSPEMYTLLHYINTLLDLYKDAPSTLVDKLITKQSAIKNLL